jgi:hypothetical protein
MKIHCLYDALVPVTQLKAHPKNPNTHDKDQIKRLAQILDYQGWRYPVKISKRSGCVTSGHGRWMAAVENSWPEVPVNYQDYESEEQEYADVVSDNAIADWAVLDFKSINTTLPELGPDFNIDLLGIKDFEMDAPAHQLDDKEDKSKLGQFIIEAIFPTEADMLSVYQELLDRGIIVKYKNG